MGDPENNSSKIIFSKLYVKIAAITAVLGTLIAFSEEVTQLAQYAVSAVGTVFNYGEKKYHVDFIDPNDQSKLLLKRDFPSLQACNVRGTWFGSPQDGINSNLVIEYQNCSDAEHCEEETEELQKQCINDSLRWANLSASVYTLESGEYIYTGDFFAGRPVYSEILTHGPFVVSFLRDDDQEYLKIFIVDGESLKQCGKELDGGAYESVVSYSAENDNLQLDVIDGSYKITRENCDNPQTINFEELSTANTRNDFLEIKNKNAGPPVVEFNGAEITAIKWIEGQFGLNGEGEIEVDPTSRIYTKNRCEFSGFKHFLNDNQRGYILSDGDLESGYPNISCYSDDVSHSDSWASTYTWHLLLRVVR